MTAIIPMAPKRRSHKRLIIVLATVAVVVAAGVGFAFTPLGSQFYGGIADKIGELFGKKEPEPNGYVEEPASPTDTNKLYASASDNIKEGKTEEATTAYQSEIDSTEDPAKKASLYMELSGALLVEGGKSNLATALNYAQQAEKLNPTAESAAQLVQVYEAQGNTSQAKKYQQLIQQRDTSEWKDR